MEKTELGFKVLKRIKDEKFSIDRLHEYTLIIQIGVRDLQLAVVDPDHNRCIAIEDIILSGIDSVQSWREHLEEVFDNHHFLKAGFWKNVRVSIKNQKFSQVPAALFIPGEIASYLGINCQFNPESETALYYKSLKSDVVTCFAIDTKVYDWLLSLYPNSNVGFIHQSSALIEGVIDYARTHKNITMYLYVDRFKLHIMTLKGKKVEYYNQFNIKKFEEYIKYMMLVVKGLRHDQSKSNIVLWGYIGKQSPHYNEFYKYIQTISFGDRPDYFRFGFVFDEIQDHHFFDLYSSYLCE